MKCRVCSGYGYAQIYVSGRVMRVHCDCEAGDRTVETVKNALREVGLDPDDPHYRYHRVSDFQ
jgi:hypothetical protein